MACMVVVVTGGIASGKSAVTQYFSELGITIADADIAARDVVEPGQPALQEIVEAFGSSIVENGILNRKALREFIFNDANAKQTLEAILHPRIRSRLKQQCEDANSDYVIAAIPLLTEVGGRSAYPWVDRIAVVDTSREQQFQRLIKRDHIDAGLANKMLDTQATRLERLAIADDVLMNQYDLASLKASVQRLDIIYRKLA